MTGVDEVIDFDSMIPVYVQLAGVIRRAVETGEIPPGRAIPSKRALVETYGISGSTVDKAVRLLKDEGVLVTVLGKGLYAAPSRP